MAEWELMSSELIERVGGALRNINSKVKTQETNTLFTAAYCEEIKDTLSFAENYLREKCVIGDKLLYLPNAPGKSAVGHRLHQMEVLYALAINSRRFPGMRRAASMFILEMEPYLARHRHQDGMAMLLSMGLVQVAKRIVYPDKEEEAHALYVQYSNELRSTDPSEYDWVIGSNDKTPQDVVDELSCRMVKCAPLFLSLSYEAEYMRPTADKIRDLNSYSLGHLYEYTLNKPLEEMQYPFNMMIRPDYNVKFERILSDVWLDTSVPLIDRATCVILFFAAYELWGKQVPCTPNRGDNYAIQAELYGADMVYKLEGWAYDALCTNECLKETASLNEFVRLLGANRILGYVLPHLESRLDKIQSIGFFYGLSLPSVIDSLKLVDNEAFMGVFVRFFKRLNHLEAANEVWSAMEDQSLESYAPGPHYLNSYIPQLTVLPYPAETTVVGVHNKRKASTELVVTYNGGTDVYPVDICDYISYNKVAFKEHPVSVRMNHYERKF